MSESLSSRESVLLIRLRKADAFKGQAQPVWISGASDWKEAKAAAGGLVSRGFARAVTDSNAPGIIHLELTPEGVGIADQVVRENSPFARLLRFNWLGWLTFLAAVASAYFAYTGPGI